jgi:hypothetical protein
VVNMLPHHQRSGPLLGSTVFSMWFVLRLYNEGHQEKSVSLELAAGDCSSQTVSEQRQFVAGHEEPPWLATLT